MERYVIDSKESASDFIEYVKEMPTIIPKVKGNIIEFNGDQFEVELRYRYILRSLKNDRKTGSDSNNCDDDRNLPDLDVNEVKLPSLEGLKETQRLVESQSMSEIDSLIFGKDNTQNVVAIEIVDDEVWLFKADGSVEKRPNEYWILASRPIGKDCEKLEGSLFYKYKKVFTDEEMFKKARGQN